MLLAACVLTISVAGCGPASTSSQAPGARILESPDTSTVEGVRRALLSATGNKEWKTRIRGIRTEQKLGTTVGIVETDLVELEDATKVEQVLSAIAALEPRCAPNWEVFGPDIYDSELVFLGRWSERGPQLREVRKVPETPDTAARIEPWLRKVFGDGQGRDESWLTSIRSVRRDSQFGHQELVVRTDLAADSAGREKGRLIAEAIRMSRTPLCDLWTVLGADGVVVLSGGFETEGARARDGVLADGYTY